MIRQLAQLMSVVLFCGICSQSAHPQSSTPPTSPAAPQQQQRPVHEPATVLKATTRLVVLDVVATYRQGGAVTDLKAQDFTVLEDGKRQEVRVFNFRQPPTGATTAPKPARLPPNVFSNAPAFSSENSLNVIVLDLLNTDFEYQAYGRQQVLKYLGSIPDGQPVAVALYTLGRKLRLLQDFTSDFAALRSVVNGVKDERSLAQDSSTVGTVIDNPIHVHVKELAQAFEGTEQLDRRVQYTLESLAALAKILSVYPGRKNLIWISSTFPIGVSPEFELNGFDKLRDYEQSMVFVWQALVDAQIAVYPLDPRGPLSLSQYGGSNNDAVSGDTDSGLPEFATMKQVARFTGGKAFYNQNDLDDAIRSSIVDGSTYYTLAYYPDNKNWNGKFRKIDVKVNRHEVKLRHRPGYYALNTDANSVKDSNRPFAVFARALDLDSPVSSGLRFEAGIVQPSQKTQNKLLLNLALDPHAISFETQEDGLQHAKVDCVVHAYDEKGKLVQADGDTLSFALSPEAFSQAMQNYLLGRVTIALPAGPYLLRLGVMDERTGLIGTTNARITVAPSAGPAEVKPKE